MARRCEWCGNLLDPVTGVCGNCQKTARDDRRFDTNTSGSVNRYYAGPEPPIVKQRARSAGIQPRSSTSAQKRPRRPRTRPKQATRRASAAATPKPVPSYLKPTPARPKARMPANPVTRRGAEAKRGTQPRHTDQLWLSGGRPHLDNLNGLLQEIYGQPTRFSQLLADYGISQAQLAAWRDDKMWLVVFMLRFDLMLGQMLCDVGERSGACLLLDAYVREKSHAAIAGSYGISEQDVKRVIDSDLAYLRSDEGRSAVETLILISAGAPGQSDEPAAVEPVQAQPRTAAPRDLAHDEMLRYAIWMRQHPTPAEEALWQALRLRQPGGVKFRRKHRFNQCIVDFYCYPVSLIIEIDGPEEASRRRYPLDSSRLPHADLTALRIASDEILHDLPGVLERIRQAMRRRHPAQGQNSR